jgi:hypothetical protein
MEVVAMKRWMSLLSLSGLLMIAVGCKDDAPEPAPAPTGGNATAPDDAKSAGETAEHSHGAGPHGGAIADWGGGAYHVEFTVDHDAKEATVYVLGSDGATPAPIKAATIALSINEPATDVELKAKPMEGEAEGTSSRFVGQHETIGKVQEFAGTISGEIDGTPYVGEFAEVAGEN